MQSATKSLQHTPRGLEYYTDQTRYKGTISWIGWRYICRFPPALA
jgi:hypothetical protein